MPTLGRHRMRCAQCGSRKIATARGSLSWPSIEPHIAAYDREQSHFFKTLPIPSRMPTPDEVERSTAQRQMFARRVRRADVGAPAILAITRLIAEGDGTPADLMPAALQEISDRRGIEPSRLMAKWESVFRDEAAALAWHPIGKAMSRPPRGGAISGPCSGEA
jgi:hypothetical protein